MNTPAPFADALMHTVQLQGALLALPSLRHCPHAPVLLAALAALRPEVAPEQILAAWPSRGSLTDMWTALLAHLGYGVQNLGPATPRLEDGVQVLVTARGDILVWAESGEVWSAHQRKVIDKPRTMPRGRRLWVSEEAIPEGPALLKMVLKRYRPIVLPLLVGSLLIQLLGVLVPVFIMVVYDHVIDGRAPVGYYGLFCGLLVVLGVECVLRALRGRLLARLGVKASTLLANLVMGKLLHFPAALVERAGISSQLSRLRGLEIIREVGTSPLVLGLLDVPFVVVVIAALAMIGGNLVWIPLALVGAYGLMMLAVAPWVRSVLLAQATTQEQRQNLVLEACQNALPLRADGLSEFWLERLEKTGRTAALDGQYSSTQQHVLDVLTQVGGSLAGLATLTLGVMLVGEGRLTPGALVAAMMLVWRVMAPLALVCTSLPRLVQLKQTMAQLRKLLDIPTETPPLAVAQPMPINPALLRGELAFNQVSLRYNREHTAALGSVSFRLAPGQLMAVMGANGSGKSSVLRLLMGLYQPQGGTIRLDGIDLRQWDPERLRQHTAYLPQQPELFSASIADNLRLANPVASEAQLWHALEQSGAAETVRELPDGLHHPLQPQQQLNDLLFYQLSLARLFLHPGQLVLCDELSPHIMNGAAGAAFCRWLETGRGNRTVLVVSSHPKVVALADTALGLRGEASALVGPAVKISRELTHLALQPQTQAEGGSAYAA